MRDVTIWLERDGWQRSRKHVLTEIEIRFLNERMLDFDPGTWPETVEKLLADLKDDCNEAE